MPKSKTGLKKKVGNMTMSEVNNKTGKRTTDIISEEQIEDDSVLGAQIEDIIVDPDIRMIEEYDLQNSEEQSKWENILDVSKIIDRKDARNPYIMSCKVLGVVPVSSLIDALSSSEIRLAHYGIGVKGAQALAKSLEV